MPNVSPEVFQEAKGKLAEAVGNLFPGGKKPDWSELANGGRVRVFLESDNDTRIEDAPDCFGTFGWQERNERGRPSGMDGAARKITTRQGPVWWQPPADVVADPAILQSVEARVRGWFLEQWSYCGVVVEYLSPPCPHCGERKESSGSLWGIETDAGDYFQEVAGDVLALALED